MGGHVTVSVGLAAATPADGGLPAEQVARADAELYRAKRAGWNLVVSAYAGARPG